MVLRKILNFVLVKQAFFSDYSCNYHRTNFFYLCNNKLWSKSIYSNTLHYLFINNALHYIICYANSEKKNDVERQMKMNKRMNDKKRQNWIKTFSLFLLILFTLTSYYIYYSIHKKYWLFNSDRKKFRFVT